MDTKERQAFEATMHDFSNRRNVKRPEVTVDAHERDRGFLNEGEMDSLLTSAKKGRFGQRDHTMLLLMYRHCLRVSELLALRRDAMDLNVGRIWVKGRKVGLSTHQPLAGDELRALRSYLRKRTDGQP